MRIYGTYSELRDILPEFAREGKPGKLQLVWSNLRNDCGETIEGEYLSNPTKGTKKCIFGERYAIDFKKLEGQRMIHPTKIQKTPKNLRCDVVRSYKDDYIFIRGKFRGKKLGEIDKAEVTKYLLYLGKNSYNEMTIINVLNMLKKLEK